MILIFGGTTEGRELAEILLSNGHEVRLSVVSDIGYEIGKNSIKGDPVILKGRMDKDEMADLIVEEKIEMVIDATHPFATEVSLNIKAASKMTGIPSLRFQRDKIEVEDSDLLSSVADFEGAVKRVKETSGRVFLAIGSKQIDLFMKAIDDPRDAIVRILPDESSLKRCLDAGLLKENVIMAKGPFSTEDNIADIKRFKPSIIITKNSGLAGGTGEKIAAAKEEGVPIVLIDPPLYAQDVFTDYGALLKMVGKSRRLESNG